VGSAVDCQDHRLPENGYHTLPTQVSLRLLATRETPEVMKFFIVVQSLSLCFMGYLWFGHATSRSFTKWSFDYHAWRLKLHSVTKTYSSSESFVSLSSPLLLAVTTTQRGCHCCPFSPHLAPYFAPLLVALNGVACLPPMTAFPLPRKKQPQLPPQWRCAR
jgi:hypothetical protein